MTTIINLFGAPGCGKSTLASGLFYEMKKRNYSVELVTEYAKDMVWEERFNIFADQIYILGKQNRRVSRLQNKVDYIITDSPIIMGTCYMSDVPYSNTLEQLIKEVFLSYDNINIFLIRKHEYQKVGRNQNEEEANNLAEQIRNLLINNDISFIEVDSDKVDIQQLLELIK